jgi:hypothetical protein
MPSGQMRIVLRFKQVQSRSLATCSADAVHAYLLPTLPTSLNADGRQPICLASTPAHHTLMPHTVRGRSDRIWLSAVRVFVRIAGRWHLGPVHGAAATSRPVTPR